MAEPALFVLYAYPGFVVARRRPRNRVGWFLLVSGLGWALDALAHTYTDYALSHGAPGITLSAWVCEWAFAPSLFPLFLLLLAFPDGRLPGGRWRIVTCYVGVCAAWGFLTASFIPGSIDRDYYPDLQNPFGVPWLGFFHQYRGLLSFLVVLCPFLLSSASLLFRFRRSTGVARRQFQWVAFGALAGATLAVTTVPFDRSAWFTVAIDLILVVLSASIAVAIVRHNLFDIDRLLSRSIVYLALTACVVGLYLGTVGALGLALQHFASGALAPLLATGIVAVLLQPLRAVIQRWVSKLVYGLRDDPYAALATLGRRLEGARDPTRVLPEAVSTVAEALRLPYVAIELDNMSATGTGRTRVAAHGGEVRHLLKLRLVQQGEVIGMLVVGPRSPDERFSAADLRLLRDVARHLAQAASAVRLSLALLRARERAVGAAAEERRRLAGDLHDGVGPVLTGAAWTLQAALDRLPDDPDTTRELLSTALIHVRQGTEDLRRISMGLRSPVDQLGLREAVLAYLDRVPLTVHRMLPAEIPRLPAAVEEAAYGILAEAVANVLRHARADNCWVRVELSDALVLTVADDGRGLPGRFRPGVGMGSMRERAAAIGGTCDFRPRTGAGTEVVTRLPLSLPGAEEEAHSG
ncbi:GAF domain-containing sensor histidine kinase [Streptomyces luteireticuli]|uniref:sensor histidine kinase n=1 Tax=Streptomyces luteireticuli TaxID=173858 RepID=UPI0031DFEF5E